jgi:predicted dehydrogenase
MTDVGIIGFGGAGQAHHFVHDRRRETDNATPLVYSGCRFVDPLRWLAGEEIVEVFAAHYPVRLYEHSPACVEAIEDFLGAIRDRRPPLCSVDEAGRTVLACLAGVESYRTNRPVKVPELEA